MESNNQFKTLKQSRDFLCLKRNGRRVFPSDWLIVNYIKNDIGTHRMGWTIPKGVGPAVLRNKLKRWARVVMKSVNPGISESVDLNLVFKIKNPVLYKNLSFYEFQSSIEKSYRKIKFREKKST